MLLRGQPHRSHKRILQLLAMGVSSLESTPAWRIVEVVGKGGAR
jgi:hypothetical protein